MDEEKKEREEEEERDEIQKIVIDGGDIVEMDDTFYLETSACGNWVLVARRKDDEEVRRIAMKYIQQIIWVEPKE